MAPSAPLAAPAPTKLLKKLCASGSFTCPSDPKFMVPKIGAGRTATMVGEKTCHAKAKIDQQNLNQTAKLAHVIDGNLE